MLPGGTRVANMRTNAVTDNLQSEVIKPIKPIRYILAIPRKLLRSREWAEVFEGRPVPFAELANDGVFAKTVKATATALGLNHRPVLQAQTLSLLVLAVESSTAAAFLPEVAVRSLPEERFALVSAEGMNALDRNLSLAWNGDVAKLRSSVNHAITRFTRLRRVLA